jgi:hypothetical protein
MCSGRHRAGTQAGPSGAASRERLTRILWLTLLVWWPAVTVAREAGWMPMDWRSDVAAIGGTIGFATTLAARRLHQQREWRQSSGRSMNPVTGDGKGLPGRSADRLNACEARLTRHDAQMAEVLLAVDEACSLLLGPGSPPPGSRRHLALMQGGKAG